MADDHLLYFLANRGLYREGKIDVLSAQSSILKSREIIKKLIELKESEKKYKTRIAKNLSKTKTEIKKFEKTLPKTREETKPKQQRKIKTPPKNNHTNNTEHKEASKRKIFKDPIQQEINEIEEKLKELGV